MKQQELLEKKALTALCVCVCVCGWNIPQCLVSAGSSIYLRDGLFLWPHTHNMCWLLHTHPHTHTHTHTHTCTYTNAHAHNMCMLTHTHTHTHKCTYTNAHAHNMCMLTHSHTYTHTLSLSGKALSLHDQIELV